MEYSSRPQEIREKPSYSPINSPKSNGTNTNSSVCSSNNNTTTTNNNTSYSPGVQIPTTPKLTTPRSDSNPYPTTFVQADTTNFKHVVQMLTGSSETVTHQSSPKPTTTHHHHHPHHHPYQDPTVLPSSNKTFNIPPIKTAPPKKQGFKLYERRSTNLKNNLMINTLMPNFAHQASGFSPRNPTEILSPSLLDFPSLTLSPVTPLNDDPFDKSSSSPSLGNSSSEEDRAIAEKGFYLHPSPRTTTPRGEPEPRLLPLFPVTSPRVSGSSS